MDALQCLLTRNACSRTQAPAPNNEQLDRVFQAALRAPDHARLRPWRFITIQGASLTRFAQLFVDYAELSQGVQISEPEQRQKIEAKAYRAPLVIVVVVGVQEHNKVPKIEQYLSAAAATQNILLALHAEGFSAIWRTGDMAYAPTTREAFALAENEHIIGFVYTGTALHRPKPIPVLDPQDFVSAW